LAQVPRITSAVQVFPEAFLVLPAMNRLFVFFALAFTANADGADGHSTFQCSLNGGEAADSLMDAMVYIWASVERCEHTPNTVECTVDITSAIASVTDMINFILGAVQSCGGGLQGEHAQCGKAIGHVTSSLAHITASSAGIVEHCPNSNRPAIKDYEALQAVKNTIFFRHNLAHCILDVKSLSKTLFYASGTLVELKTSCQDKGQKNGQCTYHILQVVSAFAWMGKFIAGAVGHCSRPMNDNAACASDVMGLIGDLDYLGSAGEAVHKFCTLSDSQRLYLEKSLHGDTKVSENGSNFMNIGMVAFIPVTAVLSFLAGRRMKASASDSERACSTIAVQEESLE